MIENYLDLEKGIIENYTNKIIRKASDMTGFYQNITALRKLIEMGDPTIYEVYTIVHDGEGELCYGLTILHPGKVGNEYFMTKGHYHKKRDRGELYIGIRGEGLLIMQNDKTCKWYKMHRGSIIYVPPYWAHRSINLKNDDFVFLAVYPGDAGHDYGSIAKNGFAKIVVEEKGVCQIKDNPKWK